MKILGNIPGFLFWRTLSFASEDEGRTEDPTEQKIRKAREDGKVAKSSDITAGIIMIFSVLALGIWARYSLNSVIQMTNHFLTIPVYTDITKDKNVVAAMLVYFVKLVLPFGAIAFLAALLGNLLQVGFLFSLKPIRPDFKKIVPNFGRWLKRSLFSQEAFFNLAKGLLKVFFIVLLAYANIRVSLDDFAVSADKTILENLGFLSGLIFRFLIQVTVLMSFMSIPDYLFQKKLHRESLKMTKHEIKEEAKETEGDPQLRNRLRQRMKEILSSTMIQNIPQADVVLTNPTHFAVALEWKSESMSAPLLTAKGQDKMAFKIRDIAQEHNIPVVENKPLTRALFHNVEIGDPVPEEYWEVVSLILAEVYRLNGRMEEFT